MKAPYLAALMGAQSVGWKVTWRAAQTDGSMAATTAFRLVVKTGAQTAASLVGHLVRWLAAQKAVAKAGQTASHSVERLAL